MRLPHRGRRQAYLFPPGSHLPHQPRCFRYSLVSLGLTLWLFFFGYFVGVYHSDAFQRVHSRLFLEHSNLFKKTLSFSPLNGGHMGPTHSHSQISSLAWVSSPSSGLTFPICNGDRQKADALSVYKPIGSFLPQTRSGSQFQTFEATREQVRSGLSTAIDAQHFSWCDPDAAFRFFNTTPPKCTGWDTSSTMGLTKLWSAVAAPNTAIMHCAHFNAFCGFYSSGEPANVDLPPPSKMSTKAMILHFEANYIAPKFWPNTTVYVERMQATPTDRQIGEVILSRDAKKIRELSRGQNTDPPEVGIIYGAYVTRFGSVFSASMCVPGWPDEPREDWRAFTDFYISKNQTKDWLDVKEVMVITHHHQGMGWHFLTAEAYRLLIMLPYLQAHPDIFIHISGDSSWAEQYEWLFDIPRWRFICEENIRADIVYVVESVERFDIPSLGMTQIIQHDLLDMVGLPLDRRRSILAKPTPKAQPVHGERVSQDDDDDELVVRIVVIGHRRDNWRGGNIVNHLELLDALEQLAHNYPATVAGRVEKTLRIEVQELVTLSSPVQSRKIFAHADIVIGAQGNELGHMYAARPGTHVIELATNKHVNIFAAARLGLSMHAFTVEETRKGIEEGSSAVNFIVDIPALLRVVEHILNERFLPR